MASRHTISKRLIVVCAWCKRIQDDSGSWVRADSNGSCSPATLVSHGICPDCKKDLYAQGGQQVWTAS